MATAQPDELGLTFHCVASGLTITESEGMHARGRVLRYGDELLVTEGLRRANTDRLGNPPIFDLTEEEQRDRYGKVYLRLGEWPRDASRLEPGSQEWDDTREAARRAAWRLPDARERQAALAEITAKYGAPPVTSRTLAQFRR